MISIEGPLTTKVAKDTCKCIKIHQSNTAMDESAYTR